MKRSLQIHRFPSSNTQEIDFFVEELDYSLSGHSFTTFMLSIWASGHPSPRTQTGGAERKLVLKLATGSKRAGFSRVTVQKTGQKRNFYIVVQPRRAVQGAGDGYIRANANAMRAIERAAMRSGTETE